MENLNALILHILFLAINLFFFNLRISLLENLDYYSILLENRFLTNLTHDAIILYYIFAIYYDLLYLFGIRKSIPETRYPKWLNAFFDCTF